jgi:hypothetical protein
MIFMELQLGPWRVLADVVMYLHILLPLLFAGVVMFSLIREIGFRWRLLCYMVMGFWVIMEIAPKFGWTKNCPLTDLEYLLRRHYDPSESWVRIRSLPATIIFNVTGIEVPEFVFTAMFVIILATVIGVFITRSIIHKRPSRDESDN